MCDIYVINLEGVKIIGLLIWKAVEKVVLYEHVGEKRIKQEFAVMDRDKRGFEIRVFPGLPPISNSTQIKHLAVMCLYRYERMKRK